MRALKAAAFHRCTIVPSPTVRAIGAARTAAPNRKFSKSAHTQVRSKRVCAAIVIERVHSLRHCGRKANWSSSLRSVARSDGRLPLEHLTNVTDEPTAPISTSSSSENFDAVSSGPRGALTFAIPLMTNRGDLPIKSYPASRCMSVNVGSFERPRLALTHNTSIRLVGRGSFAPSLWQNRT